MMLDDVVAHHRERSGGHGWVAKWRGASKGDSPLTLSDDAVRGLLRLTYSADHEHVEWVQESWAGESE